MELGCPHVNVDSDAHILYARLTVQDGFLFRFFLKKNIGCISNSRVHRLSTR